jgi:hypothetical protein
MVAGLNIDLSSLARALGGEVKRGQVLAPGPGHSAHDRSMSVKLSDSAPDGFIVHSFANDDINECRDYVRQKVGAAPFRPNGHRRPQASAEQLDAMLRAAINKHTQEGPQRIPSTTYDYTDETGELLYQVLRYDNPKRFKAHRPDGNGGWIDETGERRVLYRWLDLRKYPDATAFVTEGEKDADRIASLEQCGTTVAFGDWDEVDVAALKGRDCLILEDNDAPGREKAIKAATKLYGTAATVRIVRLPDLPDKGDISDWLNADPRNNTVDRLIELCFDAPVWEPPAVEQAKAEENASVQAKPAGRLIQSSKEFVAGYVPPDYLIDGLLQRRYIYALTGKTGAGKTTIALYIAALVALGSPLGEMAVDQGRVLMFAGENPDDVRARWIALSQHMGFDHDAIDVHFIPGKFKISALIKKIREEVNALGGVALLIIDTSAAYFEGSDENDNVQLGQHASNMRELKIPGGPCTIICCHPTKNATDDNLQPRGGGAFVAEVDGNLTCRIDNMAVELHWQTKFRGPDFAPTHFMLESVTHERLKDTKGRLITTVIARHLSDKAQEELAKVARSNEDLVLKAISENPTASIADIAKELGWYLAGNKPHKSKVHRAIMTLKRAKLVATERNMLSVTDKGRKTLRKDKKGDQDD